MTIQHLSYLTREYGVTTDEIVALTEGMKLVAYVEDGVAYAYTRKDADRVEQVIRLAALEKAAARRVAAGQPAELATEHQVDFIMKLLAWRAVSGEADGFVTGSTTREEIAKLSKSQASAYITSMKGGY
jgi:hypothetical protein